MASITVHHEDVREQGEAQIERESGLAGFAEHDAPRGFGLVSAPPPIGSIAAESTRMHWSRGVIERALAEREFRIRETAKSVVFELNKSLPKELVPWTWPPGGDHGGPGGNPAHYSFFTENSKMKCPTWDLPSGAPSIGGACPGAKAAQLIADQRERQMAIDKFPTPPGWPKDKPFKVDPILATCAQCYATTSQYATPVVQAGEILRFWWAKECMGSEQGRREFVQTMVHALGVHLRRKQPERSNGKLIKPVRVHSSGDMFSRPYFECWVEIANQIARYEPLAVLWAPTRVWSAGFYSALDSLAAANFAVRPSSYHTSDPAPGAIWAGAAMGTTALYWDEDLGPREDLWMMAHRYSRVLWEYNRAQTKNRGRPIPDGRYDWACQTYALKLTGGKVEISKSGLPRMEKGDLSHSCLDAIGPDGKTGCRACWDRPDLRVHFTVH